MKHRLSLIVVLFSACIAFSGHAKAQELQNFPQMKGQWITGGNFGIGLSGNYFYLSLSPQLGYRFTNRLELGGRLTYDLNYYFDSYYGNQSWHYFGGAAYANYEIFRGLYVHVEDELMYQMAVYDHHVNDNASRWFNNVYVGGGYRQYFTPRSYAFMTILYNVTYNLSDGAYNSPYAMPIVFRVGYCFGF